MTATECLRCLQQDIHTVVAATVDGQGLPATCAIDVMDCDESNLYFLTAKGKGFYRRLKSQGYLALTGVKGTCTMASTAVTVRGSVREVGAEGLPRLFDKNPYMYEIYPTAASREALTVFQLYERTGERFDLSKKPIERFCFTFGGTEAGMEGYYITGLCNGCQACGPVCPQGCIDFQTMPAVINQKNCLCCGNCLAVCPQGAVIKEG